MTTTLKQLMGTFSQPGQLLWIGLRDSRRAPMNVVREAKASCEGLAGDHYSGRSGKRQITLIQAEHLPVIASCVGVDAVSPELLRRNLLITGINLLALKNRKIIIGDVEMELTGLCHPCSLMEQTLGPGGYNAVRGHGGVTARITSPGRLSVGDPVTLVTTDQTDWPGQIG